MNTIQQIASIFEHFSSYISTDPNNFGFTDRKTWDNINVTLHRIITIDSLYESETLYKINTNKIKLSDSYVSTVELKEDYVGYKILDVLKIEFISLYPSIICFLLESNQIEKDNNLNNLYYIIKYKNELKNILSINGNKCMKMFINYFYGKLDENNRIKITSISNSILKYFEKYDCIYMDTDSVWLKNHLGLIENIDEYCKSIGFKYESTRASTTFADEEFSFIFIDACHQYEEVKKDLQLWYPKVKSGGIFAGHDYGTWDGVTKAVDEFVKNNSLKVSINNSEFTWKIEKP